ncbi:Glycoside hydrolase, catalytic domain-containing protein [Artemisia annua]|uniref:mannan endo-1,4-beta-mannosidase n=1 Tax=Artemisia annua TaxID=35608 RepID=A0A2U1PK30_ARTAN|nr:Glycoside hydrolase, catalytic domain-containing protein [Artemisia annua]
MKKTLASSIFLILLAIQNDSIFLVSNAAGLTLNEGFITTRGASSHGLSVARTWAFSDGGDTPLQYSPGSYNEKMFKGLDFVVAEARRYKIKLILSLVNNYENLGGKEQYVNWARNQGQHLTSDDDFFTNPVTKGFYKNHVKTVLNRYNTVNGVMYKNDPTIMAWELMNEPRCTSDTSGRTIQHWVQWCHGQGRIYMLDRHICNSALVIFSSFLLQKLKQVVIWSF